VQEKQSQSRGFRMRLSRRLGAFEKSLTRAGLGPDRRLDWPIFFDAAHSTIAHSTIVDRIAVIIHVDPLTAADMSSGVGRNPNLVCLDELCFWGQLKVELSVFARLRGGIKDRCLDGSIENETDFVNASWKAIGGIMAGGIGLNNPGKITSVCCFNPDIGAFDGMSSGILYNPVKSGCPARGTER
jgi:hypothetical protein